ncbi:MAG: glycerophosphodiester phosphodiesterase [Candidatus Thorarchaeota archaeon]
MLPRIIIAHRGASGHAPENTLLSYEKAWRFGATMIELDVHETVDGHLVCIHDSTIDRTTNGTGKVDSLSLEEIQSFDAGLGQKIPLLEDVFTFARGKIQINIELKTAGIEEKLVRLVDDMELTNEVLVSSFLHICLSEIRELNEKIHTAVLVQQELDDLPSYAYELGAYAINSAKELTTPTLVSNAHEFGIKVFPWTVNDETFMTRLLRIGVDGLITDYPDVGIKLVKSMFKP